MSNISVKILHASELAVVPVATFKGVRNPFVKPENMAVAKQQIQALINEAYKKGFDDGVVKYAKTLKEVQEKMRLDSDMDFRSMNSQKFAQAFKEANK